MFRRECKRFFTVCLIMVLGLITSFPGISSNAYALFDDGRWLGTEIRYLPHEDFGAATISQMNEALYTWNAAMGEGYLGRYPDQTHPDDYIYELPDGENKVYRVSWGQIGVVARNYTHADNYNKNMIYESDININMSYTWANSAQPGKYDFWSAFLHEAGHTVGIADNQGVPDSVMYYKLNPNTSKRSLHADDRAALQAIYGGVS